MNDIKTNNSNNILENATSWRDAVCLIIDEKLNNWQCFSSGEITKEIRENRPDFRFSHWDIGQYMRDLYFSGSMQYRNLSNGSLFPAIQVSQRTSGKTRTPEGSRVFVYGPDHVLASYYEFEVDIPNPAQDLTQPYDEYGTIDGEGPTRSFDDERTVATVQGDNRLCIPRSAFDAFMHKTGKNIVLGDKIHISLDENNKKVNVSLDSSANAKAYDLTRDRGRVKYKPDTQVIWKSGDQFDISVTDDGLEIDVVDGV